MMATPVVLTEPQARADDSLGHTAPSDFLVRCKQLEALIGTLEDSFSSSEQVLSSSPASPAFTATLRAERDRRQQLLRQLTQLVSSVNSSTTSDDAQNASGSVASVPPIDTECLGNSIAGATHDPQGGSAEWKHTTLLRLRKFLRRQYRARKNKVVDSVSNTGSSGEDMADERAQLQQLASDIKSIEFEIRLLSDTHTAIKQHAEYDEGEAGSAEPKDRSLQGDSARSTRDTVKRLLKSAGSLGGASASRLGGLSSGERLARLHEGDEGDTAGEEEAEGDLRGVRRNLLELYAEPQQDETALAGSALREGQGDATAPLSASLPATGDNSHLQSVDMCIEAIRLLGSKARDADNPTVSVVFKPTDDAVCRSEEEVERGGAGPCKIARLARQLRMDDCVERENDSSPSKIERLRRQMASTSEFAKPPELSDSPGPVAPVQLFASIAERENNSSPSKIDRQRRQIASNSADVVVKPPETSIGSEPAVPVRVLGSIAEHTIPSSAASTDAWRDVDLARWAAVNRGTACPSPVPVAPGALPSRRVHPQASTATSKPVPAQQSMTGRLLDPHADGGEEVVRALAAQKFSMLEDKEALRERAAAGGDAGGAPVSVGTSDSEDSCLVAGQSRVEETVSSHDVSTAGEEALLRTIKKILNGPGSTPTGASRICADVQPAEKSQLDKDINELSLECLAALRSSAFLEDPDKMELTDKMLGDTNGGMDCGDDVCGQARLEGRGDSVDLGAGDVSDLLLKSVDASGSFAAADCDDPENRSLIEGTSLLEDFEALPVDRATENARLFPYVFAATPFGEPSVRVQKALVRDFDRVCLEGTSKIVAAMPTALGSTPMGEPSGPVAKTLVDMFDQCLSPPGARDCKPASSPGQAAREEDHGVAELRSVVKRLDFPSDSELPSAKTAMASEATLSAYGCAGSGSTLETKPAQNAADGQHGASRPMTAAVTRPRPAASSRPMSAAASRAPAENATASRSKASAYTPALALKGASAGGVDGVVGGIASAKRTGPALAWSAPRCDSEPAALIQNSPALGDAGTNFALGSGSASGIKGGGLFSAARAQAREAQREGHVVGVPREAQPSVRLAPPIRSPADACSSSPLALVGCSAGATSRQRSSSRPPSGTMPRSGNNTATRAASVSPNRQMFGAIGLAAAREALPSQQPRAVAAAAAAAASGWLPQQKRRSPPSSSPSLQPNVPTVSHTSIMAGAIQVASVGARGPVATATSTSGRTPQVTLNNKMDLMSSVRLARRNQTLASGPTGQALMSATSTGPRRVPSPYETAVLPTPGTSGAMTHELKPINCLPNTRPTVEDELSETGMSGAVVNSGQLGPFGGKRMSAPRVTGSGVASKQPTRLPPRAGGVCLEDVDVTEPREATGASARSPTEREGELPSLPATDRTSAAAAGGLSSELMLLLREAAAERLANYRVQ